jgi:hypothetical protein
MAQLWLAMWLTVPVKMRKFILNVMHWLRTLP